ncbi:hypothetical protein C8J57DRAFT_1482174 [Mycena rebaudengoi]|nr:hypothetical protein C8J57DRAFT_1482174 [Mycena rebaudengoi]
MGAIKQRIYAWRNHWFKKIDTPQRTKTAEDSLRRAGTGFEWMHPFTDAHLWMNDKTGEKSEIGTRVSKGKYNPEDDITEPVPTSARANFPAAMESAYMVTIIDPSRVDASPSGYKSIGRASRKIRLRHMDISSHIVPVGIKQGAQRSSCNSGCSCAEREYQRATAFTTCEPLHNGAPGTCEYPKAFPRHAHSMAGYYSAVVKTARGAALRSSRARQRPMSDEAAAYRPSSGVRAIPHIQHVAPPHYPITPHFSTPLRSTQIEEDGTGPLRSAALAAVKPTPPATATPQAQPAPRRCAQPHPPQRRSTGATSHRPRNALGGVGTPESRQRCAGRDLRAAGSALDTAAVVFGASGVETSQVGEADGSDRGKRCQTKSVKAWRPPRETARRVAYIAPATSSFRHDHHLVLHVISSSGRDWMRMDAFLDRYSIRLGRNSRRFPKMRKIPAFFMVNFSATRMCLLDRRACCLFWFRWEGGELNKLEEGDGDVTQFWADTSALSPRDAN